LQALFATPFWWWPAGKGWISWVLWSASVIGILGLLIYWIRDLVQYRVRGLFSILYYTFTAVVTFVTAIFLGIVAFITTVVMLFLGVFGSSEGSPGGYYPKAPSGGTKKISEEERLRRFQERKKTGNKTGGWYADPWDKST